MLFHQDNAHAHMFVIAVATINDCGFELIQHPLYTPYLTPSDFHLFPKLKKTISGTHFESDHVIHALEGLPDQSRKGLIYKWH